MIAENEMVLYGSHGVCRVAGTVTREFDGKEALYYVLEPVFSGAFTVFVPVDSPAVSAICCLSTIVCGRNRKSGMLSETS